VAGRVCAVSPPNIAFGKYWGKRGEAGLNVPAGESLAVCLDRFHARVVLGEARGGADEFYWNGARLPHAAETPFKRVLAALGRCREGEAAINAEVTFPLPARAGFAGSSASLSAFAAAATRWFGGAEDTASLSALARKGSGSACRSVPGGFVAWGRGGQSEDESYGERIAPPGHWPELRLLLVELSSAPKKVSSTEGMNRCASTSPLYSLWVKESTCHTRALVEAVLVRDFAEMSRTATANWQLMHAVCRAAQPAVIYLTDVSMRVVDLVNRLSSALPVFVTFDAGPNPVVVTLSIHEDEVTAALAGEVPDAAIHSCGVGEGTRIVAGGDVEPNS